MKLSTTLSSLLLACSSVLALPLNERALEARQQTNVYLTQKLNIATRYEIRQLRDTQANQYNLFIVALDRWMKKPQSDPTSYFAIASIHGVPRESFNNVNNCGSGCANTDGYAVHDSVLFPTWHRAYLGLFEQELRAVASQVASEYPSAQRATMQQAANALRLPYYDSAAKPKQGSPALPNLMTDFTVVVNGPKGRVSLNNPLFRYSIQDPSGFVYQYFTTWDRTLRYPNSNAANAASQTASSKNAMSNLRQSLADQFYGLFTNCHDWLHFSNDRAGSSAPGCATSMEDVHNGIHTAIGGAGNSQTGLSGGHMYYLPISSFDPSFWLHHSNIDRIFAMWQTLNPNAWGDQQNTPTASWTIAQGQPVNADSSLTPFKRQTGGNSNGFWTSNQVRDWKNLGYTYPEYSHSSGSAADITRYINNLYGPNANAVAGSSKRDLFSEAASAVSDVVDSTVGAVESTVSAATSQSTDSTVAGTISDIVNNTMTGLTNSAVNLIDSLPHPVPLGSPEVASNGSLYQYVSNIFTPRYTLNGSYQIFLFNGAPNTTDLAQWIVQPNLIGMMGVLSKPGMTDNDLIASGSIPLTRTLQGLADNSTGQAIIPDLSEDVVVPYLTKNLVWKVAGPTGEVDPGTIDGFVVSVYASTAPQVADDQLPLWSELIPLLDATRDQSGGANSSQELEAPQQIIATIASYIS